LPSLVLLVRLPIISFFVLFVEIYMLGSDQPIILHLLDLPVLKLNLAQLPWSLKTVLSLNSYTLLRRAIMILHSLE